MASGGAAPKPLAATTPTQAAPKNEDKAIQEAAAEAARNRNRARGFRSTILSKAMPESSAALKDTFGS